MISISENLPNVSPPNQNVQDQQLTENDFNLTDNINGQIDFNDNQEKIDDTTKNLTVLLEPILLVIVWLGVLFVALAVILPIYSLIGGINK